MKPGLETDCGTVPLESQLLERLIQEVYKFKASLSYVESSRLA